MLGIETSVLINWPRPRIAALPVSLVLSVVKFQATVRETKEKGKKKWFIENHASLTI